MASIILPVGEQFREPKGKTTTVSGALGELARAAESVTGVKQAVTKGNGKSIGWLVGLSTAIGAVGMAVRNMVPLIPEWRKNRKQDAEIKLSNWREAKRGVSQVRSDDSFKANAKLCDEAGSECLAVRFGSNKHGALIAKRSDGVTLEQCGQDSSGRRWCKKDGKTYSEKA